MADEENEQHEIDLEMKGYREYLEKKRTDGVIEWFDKYMAGKAEAKDYAGSWHDLMTMIVKEDVSQEDALALMEPCASITDPTGVRFKEMESALSILRSEQYLDAVDLIMNAGADADLAALIASANRARKAR